MFCFRFFNFSASSRIFVNKWKKKDKRICEPFWSRDSHESHQTETISIEWTHSCFGRLCHFSDFDEIRTGCIAKVSLNPNFINTIRRNVLVHVLSIKIYLKCKSVWISLYALIELFLLLFFLSRIFFRSLVRSKWINAHNQFTSNYTKNR